MMIKVFSMDIMFQGFFSLSEYYIFLIYVFCKIEARSDDPSHWIKILV